MANSSLSPAQRKELRGYKESQDLCRIQLRNWKDIERRGDELVDAAQKKANEADGELRRAQSDKWASPEKISHFEKRIKGIERQIHRVSIAPQMEKLAKVKAQIAEMEAEDEVKHGNDT